MTGTSAPVVDNKSHKVTYVGAAPDTDLSYTVSPTGVKEDIILYPGAAPTYSFHLADPDHILGNATGTASKGIRFTTPVTSDLFLTIPGPSVAPVGEPTLARTDITHLSWSVTADGWNATVGVDPAWLASQTGPVDLDPSFTYTSNTSDATSTTAQETVTPDGQCDPTSSAPYGDTCDGNGPSNNSLEIGGPLAVSNSPGGDCCHYVAATRFDLSTLQSLNPTVSSATFATANMQPIYDAHADIDLHSIGTAWDNNTPAPDLLSSEDPTVAATGPASPAGGTGSYDLTSLVSAWMGGQPNNGFLQQLAPGADNTGAYYGLANASLNITFTTSATDVGEIVDGDINNTQTSVCTPDKLLSATAQTDGGAVYTYDLGDGTPTDFPVDPPGFDPTTASAAQLATYQYPPRPASTDSAAMQAWTASVAGLSVTEPPLPCQMGTESTFSSSSASGSGARGPSPNWGGVANVGGSGGSAYTKAAGNDIWPTFGSVSSGCSGTDYASWAGIGGDGTQQLIQAGVFRINGTAYPFFEYLNGLPQAGHPEHGIYATEFKGTFVVNSGDKVKNAVSYNPSSQTSYYQVSTVSAGGATKTVKASHTNSKGFYDGSSTEMIDETSSSYTLKNFGRDVWSSVSSTTASGLAAASSPFPTISSTPSG